MSRTKPFIIVSHYIDFSIRYIKIVNLRFSGGNVADGYLLVSFGPFSP